MPTTDGTTMHDLARAMFDEESSTETPVEDVSGVADPDQESQKPELEVEEGEALIADRGDTSKSEDEGDGVTEGAAATGDESEEVEVFVDAETGTEYTAEQVIEALRRPKEEVPSQEDLIAKIKEDLLKELRPEQQQAAAPHAQGHPDPILQSENWLRARYQAYINAGHEDSDVTVQQARLDLLQAQNIRNYQLHQEMMENSQKDQHELQAAKEREGRKAIIDAAVADKPNLQTDAGKEYLDKALAYAEKMGETNLTKVISEANDFLAKFVSEDYLNRKKKVARLLKTGRMPKAGAPPAPVPKRDKMRYTGYDSLRDMARKAMME